MKKCAKIFAVIAALALICAGCSGSDTDEEKNGYADKDISNINTAYAVLKQLDSIKQNFSRLETSAAINVNSSDSVKIPAGTYKFSSATECKFNEKTSYDIEISTVTVPENKDKKVEAEYILYAFTDKYKNQADYEATKTEIKVSNNGDEIIPNDKEMTITVKQNMDSEPSGYDYDDFISWFIPDENSDDEYSDKKIKRNDDCTILISSYTWKTEETSFFTLEKQ